LGIFDGVTLSVADGLGRAAGRVCFSAALPDARDPARPGPNDGITTTGCDTPAVVAERGITLTAVNEMQGTARVWLYAPVGITEARVEGRSLPIARRVLATTVDVSTTSLDLIGAGRTTRIALPGLSRP
jgi:hypothetical protein